MLELVLEKKIGGGAQAELWLASYGLEKVVAKRFLRPDQHTYQREVQIMKELRHKYIVQFHLRHAPGDMLVMEYVEGGNLNEAIPFLRWTDKARIARQLSLGLAYIHSKEIIHCDIKSFNVLLTNSQDAKICDFGCAHKVGEEGAGGTLPWMAPELFLDPPQYSRKSDVCALGMLMWEMASEGMRPYEGHTPDGIVGCIVSEVMEEIPEDTPEEYAKAIKQCWNHSASERPEAVQVLAGVEDTEVAHERAEEAHDLEIRDGDRRLRYLAMATRQEDPSACHQLGIWYLTGETISQDYTKAFTLFLKSAELGNRQCQMLLGAMYHNGIGVSRDVDKSIEWYRKAANQGAAMAQEILGTALLKGEIVPEDHVAAAEWLLKAAEQNFAPAMQTLSSCYDYGWGVSRNPSQAVAWLIKAAEEGGPETKRALGYLYFEGRLTPRDIVKAKEWLQKATDQGQWSLKEYLTLNKFNF